MGKKERKTGKVPGKRKERKELNMEELVKGGCGHSAAAVVGAAASTVFCGVMLIVIGLAMVAAGIMQFYK